MLNTDKEIRELPEGSICLIITSAKTILKTNIEILKILMSEGLFGLYVTINQPYITLQNLLNREGIDLTKLFFIDCITQTAGGRAERTSNCLFINSPSSLTELGIALTQAVQAMPQGNKFIFLDALSTLLIYNESGTIAKFSHFLINKIKLLGLRGVVMSVEKEMDEKLLAQIEQFCDKVIDLTGGD